MAEKFPWAPEPYDGLREDPCPNITEYFKQLMEAQVQVELPEVEDGSDGTDS